ncbi:MAG: hypothetical protein ACRCSU_08715 [Paracoccaceae bacterium]
MFRLAVALWIALALPALAQTMVRPAEAYADFRAQLAAVDKDTDTLKATVVGTNDPAALDAIGPEGAPESTGDRFYLRLHSVRKAATENSLSPRASGCERFGRDTIAAMRKVPGLLEAIQWPELPAEAAFAINCSGGFGPVTMDPRAMDELAAALVSDFDAPPDILEQAKPMMRADPAWPDAEIVMPVGMLGDYVMIERLTIGFVLVPDGSGDVHIVFSGTAIYAPPAS